MGWVGIGSQLDGLGHIGIDGVYYNCLKGNEIVERRGNEEARNRKVPAIATRGVILDMAGLPGKDIVKEGPAFNKKEIETR